MLRGNLSTRPFYSERLATVAIGAIAFGVLLLTIFNAMELVARSAERRELRGRIDRDRAEAASVGAATAALQQTVDRATLGRLAVSTGEANDVIGQRTFSWTAFFGLIEQTLPDDVRLVVVTPRVERSVFKVSMTVVTRELADVAGFVDALLETGRFYDTATLEQQRREDGTFNAVIEASYLSAATGERPDATPVSAAPARPVR
jgi:hypothetical protein